MKKNLAVLVGLSLVLILLLTGCSSQELTSAKVYIQQKDYKKAEYNFLKALDIEPENPEVPYLLAVEIYGNPNSGLVDLGKAKKYLDMTVKRDPAFQAENVKRFRNRLYGNTFNEAVKYYNKVIRKETENRDQDLARALEFFKYSAKLKPNDPTAAIQIARIYSELMNDNAKAMDYLDEAIADAPESGTLLAEKARIAAKNNKMEYAMTLFQEAANLEPENMKIGLQYAQFLYANEMYEECSYEYNRLIAIEPDNKDLYFNLGLTYLKLEDTESAKNQFETVVALDPEDTQAIAMVGHVYFDLKDYITAEIYYRQLLDIEPDNPEYLKRLGATLTQQGRTQEGLKLYNRGRELEAAQ